MDRATTHPGPEQSPTLATLHPELRSLRILHGTADVAGQASLLAHDLRARGYQSYSLIYNPTSWQIPPDVVVDTLAVHGAQRILRQFNGLMCALPTFDMFHIHFGRSLLYNHVDVPLLHQLGKKMIFHFRGSEIRLQGIERRIREWNLPEYPLPTRYMSWRRAWSLMMAQRYGALTLVSTPDLLDVVPQAIHLPVSVRLDSLPAPVPPHQRQRVLRIAHSPTDPSVKGTAYLEAAVEHLRGEGLPIELDIIQNVPQHEVRGRMQRADLFVDQLGIGWYGNASVEALALGVPTICNIREDLQGHMAPLPFIQADKHSIDRVLHQVWHDRELLSGRREQGRQFVELWHEAGRVTERLLALYSQVLSR